MAQMIVKKEVDLDLAYINGSAARKQGISRGNDGSGERNKSQNGRGQSCVLTQVQSREVTGRNPYLMDYSGSQRKRSSTQSRNLKREMDEIDMIYGQESAMASVNRESHLPPGRSGSQQETRVSGNERKRNVETERRGRQNDYRRTGEQGKQVTDQRRRNMAQMKRRKEVLRRKIILGVIEGIVIICLAIWVFKGMGKTETGGADQDIVAGQQTKPIINLISKEKVQGIQADIFARHPQWEEKFLTISDYSRPGDPLGEVKNIFVHYTANPKTSAVQNRSYFEQLKDTKERGASAHFIIGYEGEIIQCVPLDEIAYAVMGRNEDSLSIECCFVAEDGSFTQETYDSLIKLLSWLTDTFGLQSEDILRHYDCGGKKCPIYYTENEDAWEKLKQDVADYSL